MSKAFQCDRCHEYFTTSELRDDNKMSQIDYTLYAKGDQPGKRYDDYVEGIDLCPDCTKALMLFLKNHSVDGENGHYAASWTVVPYISKEQETTKTDVAVARYAPPNYDVDLMDLLRKNDTDHNEKEGGV